MNKDLHPCLPTGSFLTCSSDDTIRVWNIDDGKGKSFTKSGFFLFCFEAFILYFPKIKYLTKRVIFFLVFNNNFLHIGHGRTCQKANIVY